MQSKTLTIMFVDMQGYTSLTSRQTREENQRLVTEIRTFIDRHAQSQRGKLIKCMGDGFLITFESPTDAINCGVAIQEEMHRRNASILNESHLLRLRVGICTGEVSIDENSNDVFGDAVNVAARIEKFCEPNEVFISESTYLAMNRSEINAQDLGPLKFKNVSEDIRVFKVLRENQSPSPVFRKFPWQRWLPWCVSGILAALMLFAIITNRSRKEPAGLSAGAPVRGPEESRQDRPKIDFNELCGKELRAFCASVRPGGGRILRCLKEHEQELEPKCREALTKIQPMPDTPPRT